VLLPNLGMRRRQQQAVRQDAITGELGDLAPARAGEQQEADDVSERAAAVGGVPDRDDLVVGERARLAGLAASRSARVVLTAAIPRARWRGRVRGGGEADTDQVAVIKRDLLVVRSLSVF